jgi:hypothetical protein
LVQGEYIELQLIEFDAADPASHTGPGLDPYWMGILALNVIGIPRKVKRRFEPSNTPNV